MNNYGCRQQIVPVGSFVCKLFSFSRFIHSLSVSHCRPHFNPMCVNVCDGEGSKNEAKTQQYSKGEIQSDLSDNPGVHCYLCFVMSISQLFSLYVFYTS